MELRKRSYSPIKIGIIRYITKIREKERIIIKGKWENKEYI